MRITFTGVVTGPDLSGVFDELCRMAGREPLDALWDYRGITAIDVPPEEIDLLFEALRRYDACIGPGRAAWVAQNTQSDANLITSMLAARAHHPERVRRRHGSYEAAVAWLSDAAEA